MGFDETPVPDAPELQRADVSGGESPFQLMTVIVVVAALGMVLAKFTWQHREQSREYDKEEVQKLIPTSTSTIQYGTVHDNL